MIDDTTLTRTNETPAAVKGKGTFYCYNYKRIWPFAPATRKFSDGSMEPMCTSIHQTHRNSKVLGRVVSTQDATIGSEQHPQQQQQTEIEMGECTGNSTFSSQELLQQQLDGEYICMDGSTNSSSTRCMSSTSSRRNATRGRDKQATATVSFKVFSCIYCNDILQAIVSRSFYSLASISMIIMNKSIDKSYHHYVDGDLSILIIIFQSVIVLGCIESCRQWNRSMYATATPTGSTGSATKSNQNRNNTTSLQYASSSFFTGIFFCTMLVTGMVALHYNTLSMIIVSRNVANLVLMVGDFIAFRTTPDIYVATIYNLLLAGAIIAALKQHTFFVTQIGLLWMMANCICTAAYILCMKQFITTMYLSSTCNIHNGSFPLQVSSTATTNKISDMIYSIIFKHNAMCIVLLLPAAYIMGEISLFLQSKAIHTTENAGKTVIAGVLCFIFNYALLNCVGQQSTQAKQNHTIASTNSFAHLQQNHRRPSMSESRTKNALAPVIRC